MAGDWMNRYEAISRALKINHGKSVRAEDLESYDEFFVDPLNTDTVKENTNQLLYGRRGSGKTLLLGALNDRIRGEFPTNRVVSFYYTATNFRSSAEYGGLVPTVKEKTHAFFHSFIEQLCYDIVSLADEVLFEKAGWLQLLTLAGEDRAGRRDQLIRAVVELLDSVAYGVESPLPSSKSTVLEQSESQEKSRSRSRGFGLKAAISVDPTIEANAALGADRATKLMSDSTIRATQSSGRRFSPSRVRQLIVEIVDTLDLDYIIIFVDEWMSLADCQIEFAERLRQCLFGDRHIAVKIAADPFQGRFNNSGEGHNFRGLEIGGDIFVAVDLDRPFRDPDRGGTLFVEALFRRLLYFVPELEHHFGRPPLVNPDLFIETLFSTRRAFEELCLASNGICRDFYLIFQMCSKEIEWTVTPGARINVEMVRRAIIEKTEQTYDRAVRSVDSNTLLFEVITPHITSTRSRYFILESRPGEHTSVINDLLSKRIIHSVPSALLHPAIRGEYDCFEIDYGIYVDLMRAAEFTTGERIDDGLSTIVLTNITSANKGAFLLDLSPLGQRRKGSRLLQCPECGLEFSVLDKAYVVRRICPHCFQDQPEEQG